jgi:glycosyltransferase involved in cell wall biosynthesis
MFNYQQFGYLEEMADVYYLIPVAFPDWWKHRAQLKNIEKNIKYVPYIYIPKFGRRFYGKLMQWSLSLLANSWIKDISPVKILASWAYPDAVAAVEIAKKFNTEFYLKVHGSDINMHAAFPERAKQITKMANYAQGILSVSQDLANKMVVMGINKNKIHVIYNGVNLEKFIPKPANNESPYIVFIGNLKYDKGVIELLQAFIQIHEQFPELQLRYIGSGNMATKLQEIINEHQLHEKIKLEGVKAHDQLPDIIAHATLLALPSYNEGVPNVVLEAMACATPVVVTKVGGIPEVVTEETGIIATEITADAIACCLQEALNKNWDYSAIRTHAESFNWARNTDELANMLTLKREL